MITRSLVQIPVWLLGVLLVGGVPLLAVVCHAVIRRRWPTILLGEQCDPSILWAAILVGGILTMSFAMLFGVSDERLHYAMIGGFAAIITLQVFVILVLNYPFSGDVRVEPAPIERVVADLGG